MTNPNIYSVPVAGQGPAGQRAWGAAKGRDKSALVPTAPPPLRRPLHALERAWLAAEAVQPGFVITLVVEGDGRLEAPPPLEIWPWMGARARGALGWTELVADHPPRLAEREGPLDPWAGPAAELVSEPGRLLFRAHHAIADARAVQRWAEDLFAALRGEDPPPVAWSPPPPATPGAPPPADQPSLFGPPDPRAPWGTHHAHLRLEGSPRRALRRALAALWALRPGGRIALPVDLRPPGQAVAGNQTGIAHLTDASGLEELRARATGVFSQAERLTGLPLALLGALGRARARAALAEDRFDAIATLSNVGRLRLERLSGAGFRARRAWWIPPGNVGNPLFVLMSGDEDGLDLGAAAPHAVASPAALAALLEELGERVRALEDLA